MRWLKAFTCLAAFLFIPLIALSQPSHQLPVRRSATNSPQEILLLFGGYSSEHRILLMLNNNRSADLNASIVVYTTDGTAYPLPDISLVSRESRLIEFQPILNAVGLSSQSLGFLKGDL
jgi:hypothetical protein